LAKLSRIHGLHRGKTVRVTIESLAPGGDGVGHHDGLAVFVARTAPGDTVDVELFDIRKSFARGKVVDIIKDSPIRVEPVCKVFDRCGGCQWQHVSYEAQLEAKHEIVSQALRHIDVAIEPTLGTKHPFDYRNKAQFPVKQLKNKRLLVGYYEHSSHTLVNLNECPVQPEPLDFVLQIVRRLLTEHSITAFDEESHTGLIRHLCARESYYNGDILVTLVVNHPGGEKLKSGLKGALETVAEELMAEMEEVQGVCANFNSAKGNKIFGEETICLRGTPEIEEVLQTQRSDRPEKLKEGIKFRLSTQSFFQINTEQAVNLFDEVYDQTAAIAEQLQRPLQVIDAYAGVGSIALWVSSLAEKVVAIEEVPDAVRDGESTVALNGVDNIVFEKGRTEDVLAKMAEDGHKCDVVIIDPPRKGASDETLRALLKLAPKHIIYVSCNPQTLARDLKILQDGVIEEQEGKQVRSGYKTKRVQPVDLFPQTYHIEAVATLEGFVDDGPVRNLEEI
jgi:23S rRNA (uracil1939-C5)-methyltransferase